MQLPEAGTGTGTGSVTERLPVAVAGPGTVASPSPSPTSPVPDPGAGEPLVALLVPLSGKQAALGMAIRDGFLAGHLDAPESRRFSTLVIDEARISAAEAYREARDAGARILVGPLLKESVQALGPLAPPDPAVAGSVPLPILALNSLADGDPAAGSLWQFGLAPEDEAREVAVRAATLGQLRALVLLPATDWGQRLLAAFTAEFTARGGVVVDTRTYQPGAADFSTPIRGLLMTREVPAAPAVNGANPGEKARNQARRRQDADLIFVATNSGNGRQIMPQLKFFGAGDLPTYSTSALWEDGTRSASDLDGVMFPDSPWVIDPDSRATLVKNGLVRHWGPGTLALSRFYALGYDAYQLLPDILQRPVPGPITVGITGTTGQLYADDVGRIQRRLGFAEIRDGRPVPLPAPSPATPPAAGPDNTF